MINVYGFFFEIDLSAQNRALILYCRIQLLHHLVVKVVDLNETGFLGTRV